MFRPIALAAAASLAVAALATPAAAQRADQHPGVCSQMYPNANCRNHGYNSPYNGTYQHRRNERGYRDANAFWPGQVAAGVVGGAIGAAGAIATAPFQAGYQGDWDARSYAERNGFVCMPGTYFRGGDGRMHICQ